MVLSRAMSDLPECCVSVIRWFDVRLIEIEDKIAESRKRASALEAAGACSPNIHAELASIHYGLHLLFLQWGEINCSRSLVVEVSRQEKIK